MERLGFAYVTVYVRNCKTYCINFETYPIVNGYHENCQEAYDLD